jgi:hypothetical protein
MSYAFSDERNFIVLSAKACIAAVRMISLVTGVLLTSAPAFAQTWSFLDVAGRQPCQASFDPLNVQITGFGLTPDGVVVGWSDPDCEPFNVRDETTASQHTNVRWARWINNTWQHGELVVPSGRTRIVTLTPRIAVSSSGAAQYVFQSFTNDACLFCPIPPQYTFSQIVVPGVDPATRVDGRRRVPGPGGTQTEEDDSLGPVRASVYGVFASGFTDTPQALRAVSGVSGGVKKNGELVAAGVEDLQTTALDYASRRVGDTWREAVVFWDGSHIRFTATPSPSSQTISIDPEVLRVGELSVAIDQQGHAHVAVTGYKTQDEGQAPMLKYFTNASGSWRSAPAIDTMPGGAAIAIDAQGRPCISYWREGNDPATDGLRFRCAASATDLMTWPAQSNERIGTALQHTSRTQLVFDAGGSPVVLFYDKATHVLRLAFRDGTAPRTTALPNPAVPASGWYRTDVALTLTAVDMPGSGVKEIRAFVEPGDGSPIGPERVLTFTSGSRGSGSAAAQMTLTTEGVNTVHFHAVDMGGHVEPEQTLAIKIDKTKPPTPTVHVFAHTCATCPAVAYTTNQWSTTATFVSANISCGDVIPSGVNAVSPIDRATCPHLGNVPGERAALAEGVTTLAFRVSDAAGNVSDPLPFLIKADRTAPNASIAVVPRTIAGVALGIPQKLNGVYQLDEPNAPWFGGQVNWVSLEVRGCDDPNPPVEPALTVERPSSVAYAPTASGVRCRIGQSVSSPHGFEGRRVVRGPEVRDAAGNWADTTRHISIDRTSPISQATLLSRLNANGWYKNPIRIRVHDCQDPATATPNAGIHPNSDCNRDIERTASQGANVRVPVNDNVFDRAGNVQAPTELVLSRVDAYPPALSCRATTTVGNQVLLGGVTGATVHLDSNQFLNITVEVSVADPGIAGIDAGSGLAGTSPFYTLKSVEVLMDLNYGNYCHLGDDVRDVQLNTPDTQFSVRKEWCYNSYVNGVISTGRVYRFTYRAEDRAGNVIERSCDFKISQ